MEGINEGVTKASLLGLRSEKSHAHSNSSEGSNGTGECRCDGDCECSEGSSDDSGAGSLPVLSFDYVTLGSQAPGIGAHPTPVPDDASMGGSTISSMAAADATLLLAASRTMTTRAPARRAPTTVSAVSPSSLLATPGTSRLPAAPTTASPLTSPATKEQLVAPSFDHIGSPNVSAPGSSLSPPVVLDSFQCVPQQPSVFQFDCTDVASAATSAAAAAASPTPTTSSLPASPATFSPSSRHLQQRGPMICPKCNKTIDYGKKKAFNRTRQCCAACAKRQLRKLKREEPTAGGGITTRGAHPDARAPGTQPWPLDPTVESQVSPINNLGQCGQCRKPLDNGNRRYNKKYMCCTYCARSHRRRQRKGVKSVSSNPSPSPSSLTLEHHLLQP
eukprot:m.321197 g.321197  ORF g.321197 m.321197 type:complete len:389 (-) comp19708_c6_seq9:281-1447(-)